MVVLARLHYHLELGILLQTHIDVAGFSSLGLYEGRPCFLAFCQLLSCWGSSQA